MIFENSGWSTISLLLSRVKSQESRVKSLEENVGLLLVGWIGDYNQSHATWGGQGLFCMKTLNCSLEYFMVMHIDATFLVVHKP